MCEKMCPVLGKQTMELFWVSENLDPNLLTDGSEAMHI
jgi:hypothetical protein